MSVHETLADIEISKMKEAEGESLGMPFFQLFSKTFVDFGFGRFEYSQSNAETHLSDFYDLMAFVDPDLLSIKALDDLDFMIERMEAIECQN